VKFLMLGVFMGLGSRGGKNFVVGGGERVAKTVCQMKKGRIRYERGKRLLKKARRYPGKETFCILAREGE